MLVFEVYSTYTFFSVETDEKLKEHASDCLYIKVSILALNCLVNVVIDII